MDAHHSKYAPIYLITRKTQVRFQNSEMICYILPICYVFYLAYSLYFIDWKKFPQIAYKVKLQWNMHIFCSTSIVRCEVCVAVKIQNGTRVKRFVDLVRVDLQKRKCHFAKCNTLNKKWWLPKCSIADATLNFFFVGKGNI